jgi:O-antigen/teichoic acid export membrane protein
MTEMSPPLYPSNGSKTPQVGTAIARGVAYSTIGNIVLRLFDVCTVVILLRALSVYDYGIYILALASYSFWTIFFLPGLQNVIVSDAAAARRNNSAHGRSLFSVYAYFLITVCIILWAGFFFAGDQFAHFVDGKAKYLSVVSWLFLLSPFETLFGLKVAILLDFGWGFIYKLLKSAVRLGLLVALSLFFSVGIGGALMSIVFSMAFALAFVWICYRREHWFARVGFGDIRAFWQKAVRTHGKWALAEDFFQFHHAERATIFD